MNAAQLASLISTTPAINDLRPDQGAVLAALNEKNIELKDSTLYTWKILGKRYGADFSDRILGGLEVAMAQSPNLKAAYADLVTNGIGLDISDPEIQAQIDKLGEALGPNGAKIWLEDDAVKLKSIGVNLENIVHRHYMEVTEVTKEDVAAAFAELDKRDLRDLVQLRFNRVMSAIESGTVTTEAEAATKFGE